MAEEYGDSATSNAVFIPEIWSKEAIVARESTLILANIVMRYDQEVVEFGDTIHVPSVTNLVAEDITVATGVLEAQAPTTETNKDILIDKWKGVVINLTDMLTVQSKQDLLKHYTAKMGYALGQKLEQDLAILGASLSQTVGTFNTELGDPDFRRSVQYLDDSRTPFSDRHYVIKPATKYTLLGIDKFVRYDAVAYPKGDSPVLKGEVGEIYGAKVHVTPETYKTGNNTSNMLIHRSCLGLAVQRNIKSVQFGKNGFSDRVGQSMLYGVLEMRDDQGCELRS